MPAEIERYKAWKVRCPECNAENLVHTKADGERLKRSHNALAHSKETPSDPAVGQ